MGGPPAGSAGHLGSTAYAGAAGGAFARGRTHAALFAAPVAAGGAPGPVAAVGVPAAPTPSDLVVAVAATGSGAARSQPNPATAKKRSARRRSMGSPVSTIIAALWEPGLDPTQLGSLDPPSEEARLPPTDPCKAEERSVHEGGRRTSPR